MSTYASPDDVCNAALSELGYERRIGELQEGSPAAKAFLDLYGQVRDEQLSNGMGLLTDGRPQAWPFSVAKVLLTNPTKTQTQAYPGPWNSATMPPPPWRYEWALPGDFLSPLDVTVTPMAPGIDYDPKPHRWKIIDDTQASANGGRFLVTMTSMPIIVYIARVLDPSVWDTNFTTNVIASLKTKVLLALKRDPQLLGTMAQLQGRAEQAAGVTQP